MTDLTRLLEYLATADKGHLEITKYSPTSWFIRLNDLDDVNATAVGSTLEQTCKLGVEAALHQGMLAEPVPRTEPNPEVERG